uniref:SWIM-type domain-containing protein n=1 Tax=Lactuca sativa TaxID=4236 RepID=A0A9R1WLE6_LACSA|nr:hypothetical protein LSAT_V11C100030630 [Lactuca sativa]
MAASETTILTPYAETVLHKRMPKSVRWQATKIPQEIPSSSPSDIYQVFDFKKTCVVNLNRRTCSCKQWHSLGIACSHAIVASRHSNIYELPYMTAYQTQTVYPLPPPSEREIPDPLISVLLSM